MNVSAPVTESTRETGLIELAARSHRAFVESAHAPITGNPGLARTVAQADGAAGGFTRELRTTTAVPCSWRDVAVVLVKPRARADCMPDHKPRKPPGGPPGRRRGLPPPSTSA